jgi:hypothetical protein
MKKKVEEDLSAFEDANQLVSVIIPYSLNSYPIILK